ncbi:thioredoxin domain-containing protein [Agriterribacter sp.]|uniref:thioredoxin domain-containing protein n=1 Tax=Agriterribacter sp. TaxID=2821509 RepID=UPI002CEBD16C|nr:thioredoxin domain-containing protein [Agriterribacter sp.]HRO47357.1 thioredoxin domain-containing protein [Agriterribacter sp.]HRQ18101.1 thioredoxin domain-containing protein [Agriterribacter sp.]
MRKSFLLQTVFALFSSLTIFAQGESGVKLLPAKAFAQGLDSAAHKQVIDVRTPEEFQSGHIAAAKNINIYDADFKARLEKLNKAQPVFVYCKGGGRSAEAAKILNELGFTNIYDLQGGIMAWENNRLPVAVNENVKPPDNAFTVSDFDQLLAGNKVLLVDFYAPWCIPCRQMEPSLRKLKREYKGKITFSRINLDKAKPLARKLNIESIPVIAVYRNGTELKRITGFQSASQLRELIVYLLKS